MENQESHKKTQYELEKEFELQKMEFENALKLRNFEIENFWKRGWFWGVLLLALLSGFFQLKSNNKLYLNDYSSCIAFLAFIVAFAQSAMNRGSKYWQERWEYVTKNRERALGIDVTKTRKHHVGNNYFERSYIDMSILAKGENWLMRSQRVSVSKITFLVWDVITISVLILWISALPPFTWFKCCIPHCLLGVFHAIKSHPLRDFYVIVPLYLICCILWPSSKIYERLIGEKRSDKQDNNPRKEWYRRSEEYIENETEKLNRFN